MEGVLVQLAGIALVLVSLGNIYRIVSKGTQIKVWVPRRQEAVPAPRPQPRTINVKAVEMPRRSVRRKLEGPQEWTFDDVYGVRRG